MRAAVAMLLLLACAPGGAPTDAGADAAALPSTDQLDLLLMIDDSNSMAPQQEAFAAIVPSLLAALATGDRDADGTPDFTPVRSLHVGVVDSNMGLGGAPCIGTGDDGVLQVGTRTPAAGCMRNYADRYPDRVFTFEAAGSVEALASDLACLAVLGTDGCGIEFELEAPLAALTRHATDTNAAFLRADSVLAIVTLNDEDDCSTGNLAIYAFDDPRYASIDFDLRCHFFASELHPIARYVDGFAALRRDPRRLVFAPIVGVPTLVSGMSPATILADPAMSTHLDPDTHMILPACESADGDARAYAGVRMTQVAQGLEARGAHVTVQSICADTLESARDAILEQVARAAN